MIYWHSLKTKIRYAKYDLKIDASILYTVFYIFVDGKPTSLYFLKSYQRRSYNKFCLLQKHLPETFSIFWKRRFTYHLLMSVFFFLYKLDTYRLSTGENDDLIQVNGRLIT